MSTTNLKCPSRGRGSLHGGPVTRSRSAQLSQAEIRRAIAAAKAAGAAEVQLYGGTVVVKLDKPLEPEQPSDEVIL
jgi:hypothetical protein